MEKKVLPFHLIVLGIQGSGKGTQSELLSKYFKMPYVGAGELIRKKIKEKTPLSNKIRTFHDAGRLLPDEVVKKIIKEELEKIPKDQSVLFEGYPRSLKQLKDLEDILKERKIQKKMAIVLDIKEETVYRRLGGRRVCSVCGKIYLPPESLKLQNCKECGGRLIQRADDSQAAIKERIKMYKKATNPVLLYLKRKGELIQINGEQRIEKVFSDIINKIKVVERERN